MRTLQTGVTKAKTLENQDLRPKTRLSFRDYEKTPKFTVKFDLKLGGKDRT